MLLCWGYLIPWRSQERGSLSGSPREFRFSRKTSSPDVDVRIAAYLAQWAAGRVSVTDCPNLGRSDRGCIDVDLCN